MAITIKPPHIRGRVEVSVPVPVGGSLINEAYINSIINEIGKLSGGPCSELQYIINEIMGAMQAQLLALVKQIDALDIIAITPSDLTKVIKWLTAFISPMIEAHAVALATFAALIADIGRITAAINSATNRLQNCALVVPDIVIPTIAVHVPLF